MATFLPTKTNEADDILYDVVYKTIDDILADIDISDEEKALMRFVITNLEETMYNNFADNKCVMIPYVGNIILNIGHMAISKNRGLLKETNKLKDTNASRELAKEIYIKAFEDNRKMIKENRKKFRFSVSLEEKRKVTDRKFRRNYIPPKTFKFKPENG